jgi:hypothetical protein
LAEEDAWERAKIAARKQYPEATGDRFYRIVMHLQKDDRAADLQNEAAGGHLQLPRISKWKSRLRSNIVK